MSKVTADRVYETIKSIYIELYGAEITESRTISLSPRVYETVLKKCEEFGSPVNHIVKVMGFRDYDYELRKLETDGKREKAS